MIGGTRAIPATSREADRRPLALVYRGPASEPGCPEAVAELLRRSRWHLDVQFVGPHENRRLVPASLQECVLYAQPGGGELRPAFRRLRRAAPWLRDYVAAGGRYLGFCLGGYLAGETPGFGLIPGDTDQYIRSPGATVATDRDAVIEVTWAGRPRSVYFQDGPWFDVDAGGATEIVAVYDNELPAAIIAPYGRGTVGVVGPHPEATEDWFTDGGLRPPAPAAFDLGLDLVDRVMADHVW